MPRPLQPHSTIGQLRYWSVHCGLTALPSFCIALTYFNSAWNIIAMLCGIATFVLAYTTITSTSLYGKLHSGLVGRSVRLGTRIRMVISLIGLPMLIPLIGFDASRTAELPASAFFTADFWFGYVSLLIATIGWQELGFHTEFMASGSSEPDFLFTYLTTLIEGLLISISLVLIAFFTLIILNARQKRRVYQSPTSPPGSEPG